MKLSIIVVNYNTAYVLKECIDSVFKFEDSAMFEIIIVDNASSDNSKEAIALLSGQYSNIISIFIDERKSFSFSNNLGIKSSTGKYVLIMNPDIIFEEPVLGKLINYLELNPATGAIAPPLIGAEGNFQKQYYRRYPSIVQFILFHSFLLKFFYKSEYFLGKFQNCNDMDIAGKRINEVRQIPCAFFLTTRDIIEEAGMMDEKFVLFFEDVDLSLRINKKYSLAVDTSVHVRHLGGSSMKDMEWWIYGQFLSSMLYFFKKHFYPVRYYLLKTLAVLNAYLFLALEKLKSLAGRESDFRVKKYRNFLNLLKED